MTSFFRTVAALALAMVFPIAAAGPVRAAGGQAQPNPANGEKIYTAQKCSVCHRIGTKGGKMGPDISAVGGKRDAEWLRKYLPNPKSVDPKNKMPVVKLKGPDMEDLIAYLLSLKGA
jgi:cytochrome c2